jgi:hypothetical protein
VVLKTERHAFLHKVDVDVGGGDPASAIEISVLFRALIRTDNPETAVLETRLRWLNKGIEIFATDAHYDAIVALFQLRIDMARS